MRMPAPQMQDVTQHLQDETYQQHDDFALPFEKEAVKRSCVKHGSS